MTKFGAVASRVQSPDLYEGSLVCYHATTMVCRPGQVYVSSLSKTERICVFVIRPADNYTTTMAQASQLSRADMRLFL